MFLLIQCKITTFAQQCNNNYTMAKVKHFTLFVFFSTLFSCCTGQQQHTEQKNKEEQFATGASMWEIYIPDIKNKKTGVVANQTSLVNGMHLVDFLISKGIKVEKVFAPEHGFRGEAGPGDTVASGIDKKTGIPIISLYGSHKKPTPADINGIEYMIFDIQDVGARFYTYISTLHYVMEACAENKIPVMVLDRPNPNGYYIDGPVLDTNFRSFVGMDPIPVVHGLTVGEYAKMANGEGWLKDGIRCDLEIILMKGYTHSMRYDLPVRPSPNLPNPASVYLYPSLCFFEGAAVSVGRGTEYPFQLFGYPEFSEGDFLFTPKEIAGVIKDPPYENVACKGILLNTNWKNLLEEKQLNLQWLMKAYGSYPEKEKFFNKFFDKLAGTDSLRKQIVAGKTAEEIRLSWQPELEKYKLKRKKYLLYKE